MSAMHFKVSLDLGHARALYWVMQGHGHLVLADMLDLGLQVIHLGFELALLLLDPVTSSAVIRDTGTAWPGVKHLQLTN